MDVTWSKGQANFQCSCHVDIFLLPILCCLSSIFSLSLLQPPIMFISSMSPYMSERICDICNQCPFYMTLYFIFLLCLKVILFVSLNCFCQNEKFQALKWFRPVWLNVCLEASKKKNPIECIMYEKYYLF